MRAVNTEGLCRKERKNRVAPSKQGDRPIVFPVKPESSDRFPSFLISNKYQKLLLPSAIYLSSSSSFFPMKKTGRSNCFDRLCLFADCYRLTRNSPSAREKTPLFLCLLSDKRNAIECVPHGSMNSCQKIRETLITTLELLAMTRERSVAF